MKRIRLVLILILLFSLFAFNFSYAENQVVAGRWTVTYPITPVLHTHSHITEIDNDGSREDRDVNESTNFPLYPVLSVEQSPDGTLSGGDYNYDFPGITISNKFSGKIINGTVTFTITYTQRNYSVGFFDNTYTLVVNYNGTVLDNAITGMVSGTYDSSGETHYSTSTEYVTSTGSIDPVAFTAIIEPPLLNTYITFFQPDGANKRNVTIGWSGLSGQTEIVGYYYSLDSGPQNYTTQTSITLTNLELGDHTLSVAAKDSLGRIDSTPAIQEFTIGEEEKPKRPSDADNGEPNDAQKKVGDPINSVTGNMHIITPDLVVPSKGLNFEFTRTYNSSENISGPLGRGWTHSYNIYLKLDTEDENYIWLAKIKDEQGKGYLFRRNLLTDDNFIDQSGEYSTLTWDDDNNIYTWVKKNGTKYIFSFNGEIKEIKDRNDNSMKFTYDSNHRLTKVTDTAGRAINFTYDANNRITKLTDSLNRSFTYNYDASGNLIKVIDPQGNSVTYQYDSNHLLTRKTNAKGESTYFTYDSNGRCTSSSGENNLNHTSLSFDEANKKTTITNSKGDQTTHYYNDDGLITKVVNPQGGEVNSVWDTNLNLLSRTNELGKTSLMEYDSKGNLTKVTDALGNISQFTYEPSFNQIKTATDAQGNVTTYDYDAKGNLLKLTDVLGNATTYTYNSSGQPLTNTNALGKTTTFTYDGSGNLASSKDALGNTTTFSYDTVGNLTQSKDAKGNITKFSYDLLNHLTQTIYADNSMISYGYDAVGDRTSATDALSNTITYTYTQGHKVKSTSDPQGNTTSYDYDTESNLISVSDQNNHETTYEYDSLNRLVQQTDELNHETSYQYDAAGNRTSMTDAKGKTTNYQYDSLNRLNKIIYPDATSVTYAYDSLGRRTSMTDSQGATNYTYDKLGRLTKVDGPVSNDTVEYTYDKLGNRLTMKDPDGKTTQYTYNALSRIITIADPQGKVTNYTYDILNNLTQTTLPNSTSVISYAYDNLNRLTKLSNLKGSSKLSEFSYTYDKRGLKTSAITLDGRIDYAYDTKAQLISEIKTGSTNNYSISYSYDPAGNRLTMVNKGINHNYTYNELNQLTQEVIGGSGTGSSSTKKITVTGTVSDTSGIKSITVNNLTATLSGNNFSCANVVLNSGENTITVTALDNAGNSSTKSVKVTYQGSGTGSEQIIYTYDELGNLIKKQKGTDIVNLSYDVVNRLKTFTSPSQSLTYNYDGEGKRISTNSGATTTNYLYDGMNVILERQASSTTASYIRNPYAQGGIGGIISSGQNYYHYDGLGSAVNLTNASGTVTQSYSYDAFGNVLTQSGSTNNSHQFLSKEFDASGLVYFGRRYYDPKVGRFITRDPLGITDGPNLYSYCHNNSINRIDPWGLCDNEQSSLPPERIPPLPVPNDPILPQPNVIDPGSWSKTPGPGGPD